MIDETCFSKEWISNLRKQYPQASPQILEKTLYAFEALGVLSRLEHPFVFKGGTALILLLPEVRRLSIDVDIVGDIPLNTLSNAVRGTRFTSVKEDIRAGKVPATHVKLFYESIFVPSVNYVLIDMLRDSHSYAHLQKTYLQRNELFHAKERLQVTVPALDDILGDKLTAYAPNTTGVLYESGKALEIVKQLFDIGELVHNASFPNDILSTFERVRSQQNTYRNTSFTTDDVLDDIIATSQLICRIDLKGFSDTPQSTELRAGMKAVHPYLLTERFALPDAKVAASRAAFIATVLKKRLLEADLDRYRFGLGKIEDFRNEQLTGNLLAFNKLKNTNPEAFYYWWVISKLLQ
ncbi:MAG: nucleotidyl transferase AbiEii/AbiGii toxin family protein [Ignavibacteriales bacterium]|nr:nucleotidyl transferase AbiEii/AbiGii toxin family protein [Ignavibacteriales bacterium]